MKLQATIITITITTTTTTTTTLSMFQELFNVAIEGSNTPTQTSTHPYIIDNISEGSSLLRPSSEVISGEVLQVLRRVLELLRHTTASSERMNGNINNNTDGGDTEYNSVYRRLTMVDHLLYCCLNIWENLEFYL